MMMKNPKTQAPIEVTINGMLIPETSANIKAMKPNSTPACIATTDHLLWAGKRYPDTKKAVEENTTAAFTHWVSVDSGRLAWRACEVALPAAKQAPIISISHLFESTAVTPEATEDKGMAFSRAGQEKRPKLKETICDGVLASAAMDQLKIERKRDSVEIEGCQQQGHKGTTSILTGKMQIEDKIYNSQHANQRKRGCEAMNVDSDLDQEKRDEKNPKRVTSDHGPMTVHKRAKQRWSNNPPKCESYWTKTQAAKDIINKVANNALPTLQALERINERHQLECSRCGHWNEDVEHAFLECQKSKRVWRASSLGFNFDSGEPTSFCGWLNDWILEAPSEDIIHHSFYMLWAIWLMRNKAVWEGQQQDPYVVQIWGTKEFQFFQTHTQLRHLEQSPDTRPIEKITIQFPQQGAIIRVDGVFKQDRHKGAAAWEILINSYHHLRSESETFYASSALHAEALACLRGFQSTQAMGIHEGVLQIDSAIVAALANGRPLPQPLVELGQDIQSLIYPSTNLHLCKVERELVENAHKMARAHL
ncbi:OLC1v1001870C1 [Oldenlandia corymbosa var. corymbosa]|uniref:OLC1v1001870C1 n=1 Tax=Oldenlandia corymbosa var. corymbosa TaxID=529605 RepID=A0AAV1D7X9_OLDCO|nr:OLC1v1001870C1 [Oldenlandia corymbosa var. corymbosa]